MVIGWYSMVWMVMIGYEEDMDVCGLGKVGGGDVL